MNLVSPEILDTKELESSPEKWVEPILLPAGITDVVQKESGSTADALCEVAQPGEVTSIFSSIPPVEEAPEIVQIAPFFFIRDPAVDTSAPPVEEAPDSVQIAPFFFIHEPAVDASAPLLEAAEIVQFALSFPSGDAAVDTSAHPVEEAGEIAQFAPPFPSGDAAVDTSAPTVEEAAEVVQTALSFPSGDAAVYADVPLVEEAAEIVQFALFFASGDATVDTSAPLVEQAPEIVQTAPPVPSGDAVVDTSAPVEEPAEVVQIAPSFPSGDSAAHISAPTSQERAEEAVPESLPARCTKADAPLPSFLSFYGLGEQPFGVTPDPAYLYPSAVHREALESLSHGIQNLQGFMVLVAEPGMGKTTLLNKLMEELGDSTRTVFFFQTQCNSREFFRYLLTELGVASAGMDLVAMHRALNEILFQEMLQGRRFVLIVDEAQNLQDSVLETIRLLSDFETTHTKLVQIVLAGQPQLVDKLMRPNLSQLRQRIAILAGLKPLDAAETARCIEHRLWAAGSRGQLIFTPDALALIAERSQGIPRNINNICSNALMLGYSGRRKTIDSDIVQKVTAKLDLESLVQRPLQNGVASKRASIAVADNSSQLVRQVLAALAGEARPDSGSLDGAQAKAGVTMTGKLTELVRCRHRGKESEFRIQVSLERESSPEIPVAERYYCCIFYAGEEQAKSLRVGQTIRIKIEQD